MVRNLSKIGKCKNEHFDCSWAVDPCHWSGAVGYFAWRVLHGESWAWICRWCDATAKKLALFALSKNEYRAECGIRRRKKYIRKCTEQDQTLDEYEKKISSAKVSSSGAFKKYLLSFSVYARAFLSFYGQRVIIGRAFTVYRQRHKMESNLLKRIPKRTLIAFRNASMEITLDMWNRLLISGQKIYWKRTLKWSTCTGAEHLYCTWRI